MNEKSRLNSCQHQLVIGNWHMSLVITNGIFYKSRVDAPLRFNREL